MVLVESKTQTSTSSSPLNTSPQKEGETPKLTLSFSELLQGVRGEKEEKVVQNGALILSLSDEKETKKPLKLAEVTLATKTDALDRGEQAQRGQKSETLSSLLKSETTETKSEQLPLVLNPEITKRMSPSELKVLVNDAKRYLKDKIMASEGFKKSEIAALPKTLKGLVQVAKKVGIDISKITLEEVKATVKPLPIESTKQEVKVASNDTDVSDVDERVEIKTKHEKVKHEKAKSSDDVLEQEQIKESKQAKPTVANTKSVKQAVATAQATQKAQEREQIQEEAKFDTKIKETPKEIKATPLFKAQTKAEISTEQIVQAKATTVVVKTPKEKADDTLKLLLQGEKAVKKSVGMTADFSVATARVIAPSATTEVTRSLESLLKGDSQAQESTSQSKIDGLNVPKADSFEVKLNEAKQMIKYLSQDVKTAIEDYKAPFTRVKVQLNPQKLGEVDLTVVQRGKNLHISLSSNSAAINTLSMNVNDLKAQLSNNGINNATLNFNNNPQGQDGSSSQQQNNHHQRRQANEEYGYFESEEANEELVNSLEIVVPHYA